MLPNFKLSPEVILNQLDKRLGARVGLHLGSLFKRKQPALIGLDISSSSVKLVELSQEANGNYHVDCMAMEFLERGAVVDGSIEKIDVVAAAIRRALKKSGTKTKHVALALPAASVITRKIVLPANLREEELEVQVESEANQYIPFALDEVSLDFDVIGPSPTSPDDMEVLIAAARKEKVEDRVAAAESAGLKPVIVDIEPFSSRLAIDRISQSGSVFQDSFIAVFDLGATSTNLSILHGGVAIYEREQAFGGNQLTQDIAKRYGMSLEEAEQKKRSGDLPDDYHTELLVPFVESIALEITRALQFFFTSTPYNRVDSIYLAGGGAALPGIEAVVLERTKVTTKCVNPFDGMEIAANFKGSQQLEMDAPAYLISCGLAMRRFTQ